MTAAVNPEPDKNGVFHEKEIEQGQVIFYHDNVRMIARAPLATADTRKARCVMGLSLDRHTVPAMAVERGQPSGPVKPMMIPVILSGMGWIARNTSKYDLEPGKVVLAVPYQFFSDGIFPALRSNFDRGQLTYVTVHPEHLQHSDMKEAALASDPEILETVLMMESDALEATIKAYTESAVDYEVQEGDDQLLALLSASLSPSDARARFDGKDTAAKRAILRALWKAAQHRDTARNPWEVGVCIRATSKGQQYLPVKIRGN